jgi:hypothetical protein
MANVERAVQISVGLGVIVEAAALAFALLRGDLTAVVWVNLLVAAGLLVALVADLGNSFRTTAQEFLIFEIALLSLAVVIFIFTFKITRLI